MHNIKYYIYLIIAMILAGSSVVTGKILIGVLPIFYSQALSLIIAFAVLLPLAWLIEGNPMTYNLSKKDLFVLFLQSLTGMFLFRLFLLEGLKRTSALESGILTSVTPAIIAILAYIVLKEMVTKNIKIGIGLCIIGMIIINIAPSMSVSIHPESIVGNMLVIIAVFCEALFTILRKKSNDTSRPMTSTALIVFMSFLMFLPLAITQSKSVDITTLKMTTISAVIYYGVFCTAIAYVCWFMGISKIQASVSAGFTGLMPITSILLAITLLGEPLLPRHILGSLITLAGIYTLILPAGLMSKLSHTKNHGLWGQSPKS